MRRLVANLRRAVSRRFFVALKRATHRLPSDLRVPARGKVLVVAPHIDDEAIPCGGTLALHTTLGSSVHVAFLSDSGGPGADPLLRQRLGALRRDEAKAAQAILGYTSHEVFGLPDGSLVKHETELAARLRDTITAQRPDVILCPFPADSHGDHQAAALATSRAALQASFAGEIWAYEVWTTLWPNVCVDISKVAETKRRAIAAHVSQMQDRDYASAMLGLNRYRGLRHQVDFAEAFFVCNAREFAALTAQLDRLN